MSADERWAMSVCRYAVYADWAESVTPVAVFRELETARAWAEARYPGGRPRIEAVRLLELEPRRGGARA